jgi:uncharacterized protein
MSLISRSHLTLARPVTPQESHLQLAQASLTQTIATHGQYLATNLPSDLQAQLSGEADRLTQILDKLDRLVVRIAAFGLVSRGKSAVLNALMGESLLPTSPLNGMTREPQAVTWNPTVGISQLDSAVLETKGVTIELIDTPGLDEIEGSDRARMAEEVAAQSDLILFVISGDLTVIEYEALCSLRNAQKPIILVFNKIDLYPEKTREEIYQNLLNLGPLNPPFLNAPSGYMMGDFETDLARKSPSIGGVGGKNTINNSLSTLLTESDIVLIAAAPAPEQIRIEKANGQTEYIWESPPPQIEDLQDKILTLLNREGRSLLALNALTQARALEFSRRDAIFAARSLEADALIWQYVRTKAIAVGFNPFWLIDWVGGSICDLAMIRSLSQLYGQPMSSYQAGELLKTILLSSGSLIASELFGGIVLGFGKALEPPGLAAFGGVGLVQGAAAGFGAYRVGLAAVAYLEQGCTWGEQGASTVIQQILSQVDHATVLHRLRQEIQTP